MHFYCENKTKNLTLIALYELWTYSNEVGKIILLKPLMTVSRNTLLQPMVYGFKTTKPRHLKEYQTIMGFYKIKSVSKLFYIYTHKIH